MKKIILAIMLVIFTLSLSACKIQSNVLVIGMDLNWPPFEDVDANGDPYGISVGLAEELGEYLGRDIKIIDMDFSNLIPAVDSGQIDVILASMTITADREDSVDFSEPYFFYPLITVMNKTFATDNNVTTKAQLFAVDGASFVGTASTISLTIPTVEATNPVINEVLDTEAAAASIITGAADAFIISASTAAAINNVNPDTTSLLWEAVDYSPIGMAVKEGRDDGLLEDLNEFIAGLEVNGVFDRLALKYDADIAADIPGKGLEIYLGE
ncbi:Arginine-binding extracellular protein ArtP precursor [Candidatus Izimaplasma bacterium HR1]|jgi:polar amino acid transport system substrate-binding protein|uniref:transporter substrate-binding domain-containing protein n=1 Tax=Candidatus Izimoplasma sp. HR1 TaxID=1541959 RepID=UPI0004F75043|nr:Arginine-binding extracellular protein ArtP precursor [Candidatus Izimaplasma bacterium HR1]